MSQSLDPGIAIALDRAGLRAGAFRQISQMRPGDARRSVYRIDLESGRVIKARLLPDEETARRLLEICRDLPDAFAPALGCYGAVLLEEWIDGEKLGDTLPSDAHLVAAGSLLAQLHATPIVAGRPVHDTFDFWAIVAVVRSAALRLQKDRTRAHVPLDTLRRMAADVGGRRAPCREH